MANGSFTWERLRPLAAVVASALLGGLTGGGTASVLNGSPTVETVRAIEDRLANLEVWRARMDSVYGALEALVLQACLREQNAIVRQKLECGRREAAAGLPRR